MASVAGALPAAAAALEVRIRAMSLSLSALCMDRRLSRNL